MRQNTAWNRVNFITDPRRHWLYFMTDNMGNEIYIEPASRQIYRLSTETHTYAMLTIEER
jgi:hypothetical protein